MSDFFKRLEDLVPEHAHDPIFKSGARAVLDVLIDEHQRYLANDEKRSDIGPLFDAGLNTAAQAIVQSCKNRKEELKP